MLDVVAVDKAIFATLKPGGYFVVADAAAKGSGFGMTENLHRADPDSVKTEIQSAGFTFDAESNVLANASDDHAGAAGAQSDQYLLRFRKPTSAPDAKRPSNSVLSAFYGNTIHSGVGTPVQRWDLYHEDGTYQEYGNTGTRAQTASWYWDTASRNCHIHEYPAQELSFTDCHIIEAGPKPGESWTEGEGSAARKYELLKGSVLPPGQ